eukprot:3724697-Amphidinium_carterae.1
MGTTLLDGAEPVSSMLLAFSDFISCSTLTVACGAPVDVEAPVAGCSPVHGGSPVDGGAPVGQSSWSVVSRSALGIQASVPRFLLIIWPFAISLLYSLSQKPLKRFTPEF